MNDNLESCLTEGLEFDETLSIGVCDECSSEVSSNNSYVKKNNSVSLCSSYDLEALEHKFGSLPKDGISWSNLDAIDHSKYTYAVCKPIPKLDRDGKLIKYDKKYGKWNRQWADLRNGEDYGVVVPKNYIVIDVDNILEATIVYRYVVDQGLKCLVMRTDRGLHFWFRMPESFDYVKHKIKNESYVSVMGGIKVDYRVNGGAVSCLKLMGKERNFIYGTNLKPEEWEYLPIVLYRRLRTDKTDYNFLGLTEGSRDSMLTAYKAALYGKELLSVKECSEVLAFINRYLFVNPLPDGEMAKFYNSCSYEKLERYDPDMEFFNKSKFLHEKAARYLLNHYDFLPTDGKSFPLIYKDGYYQDDPDGIEIIIRKLVPELTSNNVEQVKRALHVLVTEKVRAMPNVFDEAGFIKEEPYWVNLNNGRLNILTGEFVEHSPKFLDTQRIPTTYDPNAECEALDRVLSSVFEGDESKVTLYYEIVGTCLTRDNSTFMRSFFFVGEGANGKTTAVKPIRAMLGVRNIACVKPGDMKSNSFNLIELHHKMANIVEELSATDVNETDVYKQVVGGDAVSANRKYLDPVIFRPYCTVIYCMNKIPNFTDKSLGMTRRYEILTFSKNFNRLKETDMASFDPHIADKITTEQAKSYLLNRAVEAYRELYKRREYTIPESSKDAKEDYLSEENPVISWIDDKGITAVYLSAYDSKVIYSQFKDYQLRELGYSSPWMYKTWKAEVLRIFADELKPITRRKRVDPNNRNRFGQVFVCKDTIKRVEVEAEKAKLREAAEELSKVFEGNVDLNTIGNGAK